MPFQRAYRMPGIGLLSRGTLSFVLIIFVCLFPRMYSEISPTMTVKQIDGETSPTTQISSAPTVLNMTTQDDDMIHAYSVITLTFPTNYSLDEYQIEILNATFINFFSSQPLFQNAPVIVDVSLGDKYNILTVPGNDTMIEAGNETMIEAGNETMGTKLDISLRISVPSSNYEYYDEATLSVLLDVLLSQSKEFIKSSLSQGFGGDFVASDVQVEYVVFSLGLAPTSFPTVSPTTSAYRRQNEKKRERRAWICISVFWIIVLTCFALENGLCSSKIWCAKKVNRESNELVHLD